MADEFEPEQSGSGPKDLRFALLAPAVVVAALVAACFLLQWDADDTTSTLASTTAGASELGPTESAQRPSDPVAATPSAGSGTAATPPDDSSAAATNEGAPDENDTASDDAVARPDDDSELVSKPEPDIPSEDIVEQIAMFGGAASSHTCDITSHPGLRLGEDPGVTVTPLLDDQAQVAEIAEKVDDLHLCFVGLEPGDEYTVEITGPGGYSTVTSSTFETFADGWTPDYGDVRWFALPDDPAGTYSATVSVNDESLELTWSVVERDTPNFLVIEDYMETSQRLPRPANVRLALAGYPPSDVVAMHLYHQRKRHGQAHYLDTITIETDARGSALHVISAGNDWAPGCYRIEEHPEDVNPLVEAYGHTFCLD